MMKNAWDQRRQQVADVILSLRKELRDIDTQTDKLLERIIESDSPAVTSAYEKKIVQLEQRKLLLSERIEQSERPTVGYREMFELAMGFLSSYWKIWSSGQFKLRRMVLSLAFVERIAYSQEDGFSNSKISLPFNILKEICMQKKMMARPTGVEPVSPA